MSKIIRKSILLSLLGTFLLANSPIYAANANENEFSRITNNTTEPMMPMLENSHGIRTLSENDITQLRKEWVEEVITVTEKAYNQSVSDVFETDEYYIFEYDENEKLKNQIVEIDNVEYENVQIDRILYLKPEKADTKSIVPDDGIGGSSFKIIEYYGWSSGYQHVAKKSGKYSSIANLAMSYLPIKSALVSWVLGEAVGSLISSVSNSANVTAETLNKYYYRNKAGSIYQSSTKVWAPIAFVGERRTFGWCWGTIPGSNGEPLLKYGKETIANNSKDPTNYHCREKKAHYDDNTWIKNKAYETRNTGGYYDCFAIATTVY